MMKKPCFQKYIVNILDSGNLRFQPNAPLEKRFLNWDLLPLAACFGMETGWRSSIFYKNRLWRGLDSLTIMLTSCSSMFVFIACKRREVLPYFVSLLFLGCFSSLPPLSFTEPVLRMCHSFTAPSLWMGEEKGKGAGREEQRLCGTV